MEIQYYEIDFIREMKSNIKDGISDDVKKALLYIKQKNGFNVYSNLSTPAFGNKINNSKISARTQYSNGNEVNNLEKKDITNQNSDNEWRNGCMNIRKKINPQENVKKKELFLLLNKISESNLQTISKQIISLIKECEDEGESLFATLIERLFRSAMIQVSFCPIYAKICVNLISELESQKVIEELDNRITTQLSSLKDYSSNMELSDYESFCDDVAFKNRYIGCYQFITELLNNKCLSYKKMISVLKDLETNISEQDNNIKIDILVESICKIYDSIERKLLQEHQIEKIEETITNIFKKYQNKMSSRARFIFEDILEVS